MVDQLEIRWPSGRVDHLEDIPADLSALGGPAQVALDFDPSRVGLIVLDARGRIFVADGEERIQVFAP